MFFIDALTEHNDVEIINRLFELYPKERRSLDGYLEALSELREIEPEDTDWMLHLATWEDDDKDPYVSVSGFLEGEDPPEYYAIEFRPWSEWLGMGLTEENIEEYGLLDILAHSLYELTFVGYSSEEVEEEWESLKRLNEEVQQGIDDGTLVFEDVDEFLDNIE